MSRAAVSLSSWRLQGTGVADQFVLKAVGFGPGVMTVDDGTYRADNVLVVAEAGKGVPGDRTAPFLVQVANV